MKNSTEESVKTLIDMWFSDEEDDIKDSIRVFLLKTTIAFRNNNKKLFLEKSEDEVSRLIGDVLAVAAKALVYLYNGIGKIVAIQLPNAFYEISMLRYKSESVDGDDVPRISLEVLKDKIDPVEREIKANINRCIVEPLAIPNAEYGMDVHAEIVHAEMMRALAVALDEEITEYILSSLAANVSSVPATTRKETLDSLLNKPDFVMDKLSLLSFDVNTAANEIARMTRRGAGNVLITSPMMVTILQTLPRSVFMIATLEEKPAGNNSRNYNCMLVGTLNGTIKVYSTLHKDFTNKILVGYKGTRGKCATFDAGIIYSIDHMSFGEENSISDQLCKNDGMSSGYDYYKMIDCTNLITSAFGGIWN